MNPLVWWLWFFWVEIKSVLCWSSSAQAKKFVKDFGICGDSCCIIRPCHWWANDEQEDDMGRASPSINKSKHLHFAKAQRNPNQNRQHVWVRLTWFPLLYRNNQSWNKMCAKYAYVSYYLLATLVGTTYISTFYKWHMNMVLLTTILSINTVLLITILSIKTSAVRHKFSEGQPDRHIAKRF